MRSILLALALITLATPALASDGVVEINQTCAVQTGCFPGDTAAYPVTITTPGSYRLTSNLIVPDESTSGIVILTSDVGIDLNNFAIIRSGCEGVTTDCTPASGTGSGVRNAFGVGRGLSVKNGSITGMGSYGVLLGLQAEVTNLRVRWNRIDGISTGNGSTVTGNTAYQNGGDGINAARASTVSGNTAYQNGSSGILASRGSTVSGNTANDNGGAGIAATFGSISVFDNTVRGNGAAGIDCTDGGLSHVRGNSAIENTGVGLDLADPIRADAVYRDNVVYDNAGGTVIGGNNRGDNSCRNLTGPITDCS